MATHSSTLAQKIPWSEEPGVHGVTKSQTRLNSLYITMIILKCVHYPVCVYRIKPFPFYLFLCFIFLLQARSKGGDWRRKSRQHSSLCPLKRKGDPISWRLCFFLVFSLFCLFLFHLSRAQSAFAALWHSKISLCHCQSPRSALPS